MYLVLFDKYLVKGEERSYWICRGEQYDMLCQEYPDIDELNKEDIEEILVFAGKEDAHRKAKVVQCVSLEKIDQGIKIEYGKVDDIESTCDEVRRRLYGYCKRSNILEGRFVYTIQSSKDYAYLMGGKTEQKYKSMMSTIDEYKKANQWVKIVAMYPRKSEIEASDFWNDYYCLSQLSYALTMLASASDKKIDRKLKKDYERFYIKVSDRCLELEPNAVMELSTRAYFYYNQFINYKYDDSYTQACEIYERLIGMSQEWYKEVYRYTKLKQLYFEKKQWTGVFGHEWLPKVKEILEGYQATVDAYSELDEKRQAKYKKEYLKALFSYSGFAIDNLLQYWDLYFENRFYNKTIKSYKLEGKQLEIITTTDEYLSRICKEKKFSNLNAEMILDKPNYFEIKYRMAQIKQIEGIVYILRGKQPNEYEEYFSKSNSHLEDIFNAVNDYRDKVKFNFPDYAKVPQAINDFFLNDSRKSHGRFYRSKPYMKYEESRIYILEGDTENAVKTLKEIPAEDKCFAKAQKLLKDLEYVNE